MTFLIGFLVGVAVTALLAHFMPEVFNKLTAALAIIAAAVAGSWETVSGWL